MPLLVSTEDIRPFLPVDVAFTFVLIKDHLQLAAEEKLIPILSLEVYEKLDSGEYDHEPLVLYTKRALANFAYLSYSAWASVRVDDGGVSEKEDSARIDTLDGIRISCLEKGYRAIENILAYLEKYSDCFPEWKDSSSYTVFTEFPIRTATEFQMFVDIKGSRQNFLALIPAMRRAASLKLQPALGMALYEKLCYVSTAELKRLNQSYVQPALAHFAMYYGLDEQAITLDERGLLQFNNTSSGKMRTFLAAQQQAVSNLKAQMLEMGNTYLTLMLAYLTSHASDYPDYQVPGVSGGVVNNDRNQSVIGFY